MVDLRGVTIQYSSPDPDRPCQGLSSGVVVRTARELLAPVVLCVVGLLVVFHTQIFSGLQLMQPDQVDPRLVTYTLERNHQWFGGDRPDEGFWDPPFFHPWHRVGTHTESLLGLQPWFSMWRIGGLSPQSSYQLCAMTLLVLCHWSAWAMLRHGFQFTSLPAAAGAFIFAFGLPRSSQLGHVQLFAHYGTPLVVLGLALVFRDAQRGTVRRWPIWLCTASGVLQLLGSVYLTWFLLLAMALALPAALLIKHERDLLWRAVAARWRTWIVATSACTAVALPILVPYLQASQRLPGSSYETIQALLPRVQSLVFPGFASWESRWLRLQDLDLFRDLPYRWEHAMSPGFLTLALALVGLAVVSRRPGVRVMSVTAVVLLGFTLVLPEGFSLWRVGYALVPGAPAIRGVVRISLLLLMLLAIGVAAAVTSMVRHRWHRVLIPLALAVIVLESTQTTTAFEKSSSVQRVSVIAGFFPGTCDVLLFSRQHPNPRTLAVDQLDAMWAGLRLNRPTANGYSGHQPPGWWDVLGEVVLGREQPVSILDVRHRLEEHGTISGELCWLQLDLRRTAVRGGTLARASGNTEAGVSVITISDPNPKSELICVVDFESGTVPPSVHEAR